MISPNHKAKTLLNNEVCLYDLNPEGIKTVLIIGVFHGDEPDGEYLIHRFLEETNQKQLKNRLLIIPCLNPDGKQKGTRTNASGVDLNRNFPCKNWECSVQDCYYGGESAGSEIETGFITKVLEEHKPDVILTLHEPYRVVNYDGPAKEIAQKISKLTGYPIQEDIGYPTPGSFGTYCGVEKGIAVITLELPEKQPKETLWADNSKVFEYFSFIF